VLTLTDLTSRGGRYNERNETHKNVFLFFNLISTRFFFNQCCGGRAEAKSRGAEIKLPPGAGAKIKNCGSVSFLLTTEIL
jgi:hypothetical protein